MDWFMPSRTHPRSRFGVSAFLLAWIVLGLAPPATPSVPGTVLETLPVDLSQLAPAAQRTRTTLTLPPERWSDSSKLCAPFRFTMIGLSWRGSGHADAAITSGGGFHLAQADEHDGPDRGSPDDAGIVGTPPVWTGERRCVNVRLRTHDQGSSLKDLKVTFLNTSGTAEEPSLVGSIGRSIAGALSGLTGTWGPAPAGAWTKQPRIRTRAEWGADEKLRKRNCDGTPDYADSLELAYIHHTATGNGYSKGQVDDQIRGIYAYHVKSRGYCDIAYNFVMDKWGRAWEARYGGIDKPVIGGHASGFNTGSTGIAVLGTYTNKTPERALVRNLKKLVRWRMDVAHVKPNGFSTVKARSGTNHRYETGQWVRLRSVIPHRKTGYTSCPGDRLAKKVAPIRKRASKTGHPKIYRPAGSSKELIHAEGDTVRLAATASKAGARWWLKVTDANGAAVRSYTGTGRAAGTTWNGQDGNGVPVPDGSYTATFTARWDGKDARPAALEIRVCSAADPSTGRCPEPAP